MLSRIAPRTRKWEWTTRRIAWTIDRSNSLSGLAHGGRNWILWPNSPNKKTDSELLRPMDESFRPVNCAMRIFLPGASARQLIALLLRPNIPEVGQPTYPLQHPSLL